MRKLYYVYDSASGYYAYFCEAYSDTVAMRSFKYACENDFKAVANDLSLYCLGVLEEYTITPEHTLIMKYLSSKGVSND